MAETHSPASPQDWSFEDRTNFTSTWNRANVLNLMRGADGSQEYRTIRERTAFYNWFDQIREVQKQDVLWPAAAYIVASEMSSLEDPMRTAAMTIRRVGIAALSDLAALVDPVPSVTWSNDFRTSTKLIQFGQAGNKAIFDNVFPKLADLFKRGVTNHPMLGGEATDWDKKTLHAEQFDVVQPIYMQFARDDEPLRDELAALASGRDVFAIGGLAIGFSLDFKGDILNPADRYNHGMNVVTGFYRRFKLAIDAGRRDSQVSKPDPTAGGMLKTG